MKQTLFMAVVTLIGVVGPFVVEPAVGVAVYYLFAVLRPQYMWKWALPEFGWSGCVAWATIAATAWMLLRTGASDREIRLSAAHKVFIAFGIWICLTYVMALNHDVAWPWFLEYLKVFVMFWVAGLALTQIRDVWWVYRLAAGALIYIAYEVNYLYFVNGRLDIYHNGYGGLDNNGAGLMLAMGVPLAVYAWEGTRQWWRWAFIAGIPLLLHAVLMSYSRGAMLSLIVAVPVIVLRSRRKVQSTAVVLLLLAMVPFLAGKEIRARFFSVQEYSADDSANARFNSWDAAIQIANEYPVFGVGIRNSNLLSYKFGADMEGRTIHSQYLQTLADAGYPGLLLYLLALGSMWVAMKRTRRVLKARTDPDAVLARAMLSGIEGSMLVFCFGAAFLSLEVFELPYVVALCAVQISLLMRVRPQHAMALDTVPGPAKVGPFVAEAAPRPFAPLPTRVR